MGKIGIKNKMKYIRKVGEYNIAGSIGIAALFVLSGCNSQGNQEQLTSNSIKQGAFVIIEEQIDGSYKILEEHPSDTTRVLLKSKDGSERMLSNEEIETMLKEEEKKIDNGTSQLTNPTGTGLGLGEAILASAAGAIIGSWIGNKLFNNQNFQAQQRTTYKSPQAYERSKSSFGNQAKASTNRAAASSGKSGFFGNSGSNVGGSDRSKSALGG